MPRFATIFLSTLVFEALLLLTGRVPSPVVQMLDATLFAMAAVTYVGMSVDRRLSLPLLLPPTLFFFWARICGAAPLRLYDVAHLDVLLSLGQILLALPALVFHPRAARPPQNRPAFSPGILVALLLPALLFAPLGMLCGLAQKGALLAEAHSGGYIKIRPTGILLQEREFERNGKQIRLVGMMHIGDQTFYDEVMNSFESEVSTVVLTEGISDEDNLLEGGFSYADLAMETGLAMQQPFPEGEDKEQKLVFRNADIDVREFSPETLEVMRALGVLLNDFSLQKIIALTRDRDSPLLKPGIDEKLNADTLARRNDHLYAEMNSALEEFDVVIMPWGALHMPDMESRLRKAGYEMTRSLDRPVVRFFNR